MHFLQLSELNQTACISSQLQVCWRREGRVRGVFMVLIYSHFLISISAYHHIHCWGAEVSWNTSQQLIHLLLSVEKLLLTRNTTLISPNAIIWKENSVFKSCPSHLRTYRMCC